MCAVYQWLLSVDEFLPACIAELASSALLCEGSEGYVVCEHLVYILVIKLMWCLVLWSLIASVIRQSAHVLFFQSGEFGMIFGHLYFCNYFTVDDF